MSLNDGEPGVQGNLLSEFVIRETTTEGKWESRFWISTFPSIVAGAVGMWESRSGDFQGLWETRETCVWFSSFPIARHFHSPLRRGLHAVCLRPKVANSFCFSFCIRLALAVSLSPPARWFISSTVNSGFIYRARSGSCRRISQGVAYQR